MNTTFKFGRLDKLATVITLALTVLIVGVCITLFAASHGALYIAAWTTSVLLAIVALCALSWPQRIIVDDDKVELRCLVESTYVKMSSIVDVEVVGKRGLAGKIPLPGVFGFGGYYGFWIELKTRRVYRTYMTSRAHCVVIHTSHRRYLVSCERPEELRSHILTTRAHSPREE